MAKEKTDKSITHDTRKANFDAFNAKVKKNLSKGIPFVIVISWYVGLFYLAEGFLFSNYGLPTLGLALASYFLYEKFKDDFVDVKKEIAKDEN